MVRAGVRLYGIMLLSSHFSVAHFFYVWQILTKRLREDVPNKTERVILWGELPDLYLPVLLLNTPFNLLPIFDNPKLSIPLFDDLKIQATNVDQFKL